MRKGIFISLIVVIAILFTYFLITNEEKQVDENIPPVKEPVVIEEPVIDDSNKVDEEPTQPQDKPVQKGITVNNLTYEVVLDDSIPETMLATIEKNKNKKGFDYFISENGEIFVSIYSGEKPTGGYSIDVDSIKDNEGVTNISVKENSPSSTTMVMQVISYPYTVVKFTGGTPNINVTNIDGEKFRIVN